MISRKELIRPIMFVGTSSDVGKSVITAGFCRVFKQDGYHPAPFKAQNMSLNSYATPEGFEIGRAQAMQAEACGISCHTDMNPVLLKPTNENSSQVVLNGRSIGTQSALEYFMGNNREALFNEVKKAFTSLSSRYSPLVMEGAGSISELNLKARDITNMKMAIHSNAATYLIADIERGGVFGSLYGTIALLDPEERSQIKGIIINKFRGEAALFDDGRKMIEDLCKIPVVGVMPYFKDIDIDEEDSVALKKKTKSSAVGKINVAVILLERISNFTDFARLERDSRVNLYYTADPSEVVKADIVILPGTKNTIEDLITLKTNGVATSITSAFKKGKTVIGICGGYQMMGKKVMDPEMVESKVPEIEGLGILPVNTVMMSEKTTVQRTFRYRNFDSICHGYEIHMGETTPIDFLSPLNNLEAEAKDGYFLHKKCWGTYLHGILDNSVVIDDLLSEHTDLKYEEFNHKEYKEQQYDKLASWIRANIDMEKIYESLYS